MRYFRNFGLQPRPELPFASCSYLFIILSIAAESRFNSHSLTGSAANASGFLQVAVSEAPSQSAFELELSRAGAPDTALGLQGTYRGSRDDSFGLQGKHRSTPAVRMAFSVKAGRGGQRSFRRRPDHAP